MTKISIIGAGTMGTGVARLFGRAGFDVSVFVRSAERLRQATAQIDKIGSRIIEKGKLTPEENQSILSHISFTTDMAGLADSDVIIEAVTEDTGIKRELFKTLDGMCKEEAIFATNTSSISITDLSSAVKRKDKFIGMHFFNPAWAMTLIEIIRGIATSDETFRKITELSVAIGKEPVVVYDSPGFIVNRILTPMINEAACVLMEGVAGAEDIDKAMKLGANHPMGPLALSDLIGNDVVLHIMNNIYTETGDPKYRPCILLKNMVRGGLLGKKSGRGFYQY
ncbi:MAG: 3-hydroxyacyl-CoA dehydrogenase NAD-binding domain-containing protein [Oscillospiraceae bacterium]|nr:3-hydroxyacyl-CoA dehydrogenase NAD-binding domain-containing protein [Oscillospiraceae bacterium]